jgi:ribosome biogenesis GTPase A
MDNRQAANLLNEIADLIGPETDTVSPLQEPSPRNFPGNLGMVQEAQQLRRYAQTYGSDRVNLLMVGAFNNGKSTLVNALLGVEAVQTGAVPTTAVFTHLRRGEQAIVVHPRRGAPYHLEPKVYWNQYNLSSDTDWTEVDHLEITDEFERLPEGVTLIDTPGLAENRWNICPMRMRSL